MWDNRTVLGIRDLERSDNLLADVERNKKKQPPYVSILENYLSHLSHVWRVCTPRLLTDLLNRRVGSLNSSRLRLTYHNTSTSCEALCVIYNILQAALFQPHILTCKFEILKIVFIQRLHFWSSRGRQMMRTLSCISFKFRQLTNNACQLKLSKVHLI